MDYNGLPIFQNFTELYLIGPKRLGTYPGAMGGSSVPKSRPLPEMNLKDK